MTKAGPVLAFLIFASRTCAQSLPCSHQTAWISVTDREGAPVSGFQISDFQGEYRGKAVKLLSILPDDQKRRVVILLDASGSQGKEVNGIPGSWRLSLGLASDLAEAKLHDTDLALIIFNDKIVEKMDFSSGRDRIASRLREIATDPQYERTNVKGRTAIWDAAAVALDALGSSRNGIIYVISDGGDNASKIRSTELQRRLILSGTRLYSALVAYVYTSNLGHRLRTPQEESGPEEMEKLALDTGGSSFGITETPTGLSFSGSAPTGTASVRTALSRFYDGMLKGSRLEIELPRTEDKWTRWKLDFTNAKRSRFKNSRLGFARDIPPCTVQQ